MLEIFLIPNLLGPRASGVLGLSLFSLMVNLCLPACYEMTPDKFENGAQCCFVIQSLLLWVEGLQGHRIKSLITQKKQNKRHINKSKQT